MNYISIVIFFLHTVGTAYKTHGYKVQSLIRLKITWNDPDVSKIH